MTHSEGHSDKVLDATETDADFFQRIAAQICHSLRNEHNWPADVNLMKMHLALAQQSNPRQREFYEAHSAEIVLYCAGQKNLSREPSITVFNWLKYHREKPGLKPKPATKYHEPSWTPPTKEEMDSW